MIFCAANFHQSYLFPHIGNIIERFGTFEIIKSWRELLQKYSNDYKNWLKKSKLILSKILVVKISLEKDQKDSNNVLIKQLRVFHEELMHLPCSQKEANDFIFFAESVYWITNFLQVNN